MFEQRRPLDVSILPLLPNKDRLRDPGLETFDLIPKEVNERKGKAAHEDLWFFG